MGPQGLFLWEPNARLLCMEQTKSSKFPKSQSNPASMEGAGETSLIHEGPTLQPTALKWSAENVLVSDTTASRGQSCFSSTKGTYAIKKVFIYKIYFDVSDNILPICWSCGIVKLVNLHLCNNKLHMSMPVNDSKDATTTQACIKCVKIKNMDINLHILENKRQFHI